MRLDISLQQTQKLAMTMELRQSIEILQYNHFELIDFLTKESEENPTIEVEVDNYEYDFYSGGSSNNYQSKDDSEEENTFEKFVSSGETLYDYVYEQLISVNLEDEERVIGEYLLGLMDENGYIEGDLYEFSNEYGFSFSKVEKILRILQTFYPTGICSTNLSECLLRQGKEKGFDETTLSIIRDDLVDLAENRVELLANKYNKTNKEIQESFDKIRQLDPRPGQFMNFTDNPVKFIIPDLILEIEGERLILSFNEDAMPRVRQNKFYAELLKDDIEINAKAFLREKFRSTNWIIKSIEQRRETIMNVATVICERQKDFLLNKGHLNPMTMKEVAKEIDVHESTVSRTVNGKYIQTPNKVIELKDFFKGGIETDKGEVSVEEIKLFIRTTIETEDKAKPVSDQDITHKLNDLGYKISRRTVAKYRDSMGIMSSSKRKRY